MVMATIFSNIIAGEIPCHKIAEDDEFFAFLDINPVAMGHTLVVPRQEIDYIFDIDDEQLGRMMAFAKRVASAQKAAIPCKRVALTVIGLEVPHAHIHLVPITRESDIYFGREKQRPSQEILAEIAAEIRKKYKWVNSNR
jgi:histidine triad (HIT) family protein